MKKIFLLLACFALGSMLILPNIFAEEILKITSVRGKVLVMTHPSTEWADAKVGQAVNPKDAIKTEADGSALLEFPDKSSFTLKPNSQFSVEDIAWSAEARKAHVNLTAGEIKTIIQKVGGPSDFKIKTPTAICGARATVFYVAVFADGTSVYVDEGSVEFLNSVSYESYTIVQGMSSSAGADGTVTPPRELSADEKAALLTSWGVANVPQQEPVPEPYTEPEPPPSSPDLMGDDMTAPEVLNEQQASQT